MGLELLSPEERKRLLISIGTHRGERALSPVEVAGLLERALSDGTSLASCASAVGLESTSQLSRFLSLLSLPDDVRHLVNWGRSGVGIAFTSAFELSRLEDATDQREAVRAVLEHDFNSSEVRQLVQARKRSARTLEDCVATVLKMRPQVEVRHVFIGSILKPSLRDRLRSLSQQQRDEMLQSVLKTGPDDINATGRLGPQHFTLVGGSSLGTAIRTRKDELERQINQALELRVGG